MFLIKPVLFLCLLFWCGLISSKRLMPGGGEKQIDHISNMKGQKWMRANIRPGLIFSNGKIPRCFLPAGQPILAPETMPHTVCVMFGCRHERCGARRTMGSIARTLEEDALMEANVADAAERFRLTTGETLKEASDSRLLALVFLRHFGCTFTRQILRGLDEVHREARERGAELVLVHMLKTGSELRYLGGHGDVARIADPGCELYRAFGLGRGGVLELFGPRVWWLGAVSIFKGCGVGHLAGDGLQMPGTFLFQNGRIISAQRAASASDLPDISALFAAFPPSA